MTKRQAANNYVRQSKMIRRELHLPSGVIYDYLPLTPVFIMV